jgi:CRP-like cAMP-binding protein
MNFRSECLHTDYEGIIMRSIVITTAQKLAALRQNSYFSNLEKTILDKLVPGVSLRLFERGEILFWEGEPCAGLHIIQKGSVKLFKTSVSGRELIINTLEEKATFNEVPVFDNGANPVNAAALEPSEIWVIETQAIQAVMREHPELCRAVIGNLTQNLRMLVGKVEELSFYQVTNRLARLITQLQPEQLAGDSSARLTQDQIAARLGTVREVVARALRELERSGAIQIKRRQIVIRDEEVLRDWAFVPLDT